jgi:Phytanoyl-CoA dioxygenase (PhyH)
MQTSTATFTSVGFAVVPDVIDSKTCDEVSAEVDGLRTEGAGSRRLLELPFFAALADRLRQHEEIARLLPDDPVAVQCTVFVKDPKRNWLVSLHQDRSIAVRAHSNDPNLSGWSEKEGDLFVQPPAYVLEQMTAVRLHIDDCPLESGALRVVPASHCYGVLTTEQTEHLRQSNGEQNLPAPRGAAVIMKPLLLHASSKALKPAQRRVLHFVLGERTLPHGLEWRYAI